MSSIGARVRQLREDREMKSSELARAIGIRQPSLIDIEKGRTKTLRGNTLARLCEELRTTADFLLYGEMAPAGIELALMERELTMALRALTPERRIALIEYARFLLAQPPGAKPAPARQAPANGASNVQRIQRKTRK